LNFLAVTTFGLFSTFLTRVPPTATAAHYGAGCFHVEQALYQQKIPEAHEKKLNEEVLRSAAPPLRELWRNSDRNRSVVDFYRSSKALVSKFSGVQSK
jgi:hypothetical protein